MTEQLIAQVKRELNITWEDDDTNARVNDIMLTAVPYMLDILGIADPEFDFAQSGTENLLFRKYCLYDWNHVANEFADNYCNIIGQTRAKHEVKYYQESEAAEDE